jgi:hypothetical protein
VLNVNSDIEAIVVKSALAVGFNTSFDRDVLQIHVDHFARKLGGTNKQELLLIFQK